MPIKLSVIIPNYNEENNLKRGILEHIDKYLDGQDYESEVLISDDGSTDNSPRMIRNFAKTHKRFTLISNKHAGKPYAIRSAVKKAKGDYCLLTDMDQSTPIEEVSKLLSHASDRFKVVIGSRGIGRDSSMYRQLISLGFWVIRASFVLPRVKDTQCGFKLVETKLLKKIFSKMLLFERQEKAKGWKVTAYDVEMLFVAQKMNNLIKEVRVKWKDEDLSEDKGRNFIKESYEMLKEVLRVRLNDMRGYYA